ncbi:MAG TPA: hypothetical protein VI456_05220 [Polyangia bacterium]
MRVPLSFFLFGAALVLAGGCGGSSLGNGESCQQLLDDYTNALPAALVCDPTAPNQCQQSAMSDGECSCGTGVQDPTQLNAIAAQLRASGCIPAHTVACPCALPPPLACVANDGGAGTCTPQPFTAG